MNISSSVSGTCAEFDIFAPNFVNQFNNWLCEADQYQQPFWVQTRAVIAHLAETTFMPYEFYSITFAVIFAVVIVGTISVIWKLVEKLWRREIYFPDYWHSLKRKIARKRQARAKAKASKPAPLPEPKPKPMKAAKHKPVRVVKSKKSVTPQPKVSLVEAKAKVNKLTEQWIRDAIKQVPCEQLVKRAEEILDTNGEHAKAVDALGIRDAFTSLRDEVVGRCNQHTSYDQK